MQQNENCTVCISISDDVAEILMDNDRSVKEMAAAAQTLQMADRRTVGKIAAKAGHDLNQFQYWQYKQVDGGTVIELVPPPEPKRPAPTQGE
jgi:hypothetical protein